MPWLKGGNQGRRPPLGAPVAAQLNLRPAPAAIASATSEEAVIAPRNTRAFMESDT